MLSLKRRPKPKVTPEENKRILFTIMHSEQEIELEFKDSQQIYSLVIRQILEV